MKVGDIVRLEDGSLWRLDAKPWGKVWEASPLSGSGGEGARHSVLFQDQMGQWKHYETGRRGQDH